MSLFYNLFVPLMMKWIQGWSRLWPASPRILTLDMVWNYTILIKFLANSLGPSFLSTSLSFLPLQVCVYLQTKIYFDRYPLPLDTAQIVPGLGDMRKCNIWNHGLTICFSFGHNIQIKTGASRLQQLFQLSSRFKMFQGNSVRSHPTGSFASGSTIHGTEREAVDTFLHLNMLTLLNKRLN